MTTERWRPIDDFPLYEISSLGRVRSLTREFARPSRTHNGSTHRVVWQGRSIEGWVRRRRGKPMAVLVALRRDGETVVERVHRLVLAAFVGPCPAGMECCHGDGNPLNNVLSNLRWDTHTANAADSLLHGTRSAPPKHSGETHHNSRLTDAQVIAIRNTPGKRGILLKLARQYAVSSTSIMRIRAGVQRAGAHESGTAVAH